MQRLCLAELAGVVGWVAGLGGIYEGGSPTAMGKTKEEAIGNLVLRSPASFGLKIEENSDTEEKREIPKKKDKK